MNRILAALAIVPVILSVSFAADTPPAAPGALPGAVSASQKPNIIFILFDDLGWPQVPCFRAQAGFKLPSMDRLAKEGMCFTDAHAAASVCTPTRYGVLVGRYPMRIGQFGVLTTFSKPIIPPQRMTVASMLKAAGYHTACFGKWHLGMNIQAKGKATRNELPPGTPVTDGPTTRGFDVACVYPEARDIGLLVEGEKVLGNYKEVDVQPLMAKKIVAYLEQQPGQSSPFFLYVPLSPPHTPIVPAPPYIGKSGAKEYGDWMYQGDDVVGQILAALDRLKLADNTLVLVSSDNGAAGRVYPPLRGCKTSIYEGGHREPFVARWPGRIKAGAVCDDVICLNDLMATCADVAGVKLPDNAAEDSVSILPDLLGTAKGPVREATIHQAPGGELAIRQGPWKLIFAKGGKRELYNLQADLGETQNLAVAHADEVAKLEKLMERYIQTGRSTPGAAQKNEFDVSLDSVKQKKDKKDRKQVALAMDPYYD